MMRPIVLLRSLGAAALATAMSVGPASAADQAPAATPACPQGSLFAVIDGTTGLPAACPVAAGTLLLESLYYQNASRTGGSALAAYPMFRLREGLTGRTELVLDTPSQIAESGLDGAGLYPRSSPGFGVNYAFAETSHAALGLGVEDRPPSSLFATNLSQPKYAVDVTSLYRLTQTVSLDALVAGETSRTLGVERVLPAMDLGVGYDFAPDTELSTDLGTRFVRRRAHWQGFGDFSITQLLRKNLAFDTGIGTTFNPVSNAKAHYIAAGLDFRH